MSDISSQNSHPDRLAGHLTELVTRLRLSSSVDSGRLVLPPFLTRLEMGSRLLVHAGVMAKDPGFQRLNKAILEFAFFVKENPGRYLREFDRPLDLLVEHVEFLLAEIDAGEPIEAAGADPRWLEIICCFESTGPSWAVMQNLEQALDQWETANHDPGIGFEDAEALHRRWVSLRCRGDRLFEKPIITFPSRPDASLNIQGRRVVCGLLLDSSFQRDHLLEKIKLSGGRAVALVYPEQAWELVDGGSEGLVLLGDNMEPTRNLERIIADLRSRTSKIVTRCILVSGSKPGRNVAQDRAVILGASGAWTPPFDLQDLQGILDKETG
ncbi:MAG: hypothetical protein KOO60_00955 [Gemmatimonadales bacterium]|nr:hypothetical protein [Gemmatimonadales bacterium]